MEHDTDESNVNELLKKAEYYADPPFYKKILNAEGYLTEKAYSYYTKAINILLHLKKYEIIQDIYPELINIALKLNKNILANEYYNFAEVKYILDKKTALNTYIVAYDIFINLNCKDEIIKCLLKITEIYEIFNKSDNNIIKYYIELDELKPDKIIKEKIANISINNDNLLDALKYYIELGEEYNYNIVLCALIIDRLDMIKNNNDQIEEIIYYYIDKDYNKIYEILKDKNIFKLDYLLNLIKLKLVPTNHTVSSCVTT